MIKLRLFFAGLVCLSSTVAWGQNALWLEDAGAEIDGPTADVYGFAMLDAGYNGGRIDPDWYDVMRPTKLPAFENEFGKDGETYFSVRQTRFGVKYWQPTSGEHDVRGIFEWELFGVGADAGQTTFRLRHAYLQYGKFGAGQYHSVFMDMDIFPNSVEYWGPTGMILFRNIQVRYMPVMGDKHNVAISFEKPGASGDVGEFNREFLADRDLTSRFPLPDVAAHYRYSEDWGHVQLAGILRYLKWDDTTDDALDVSGDDTGWGLNLTGNQKLGERGKLKYGFIYGEGILNYLNDGGPDVATLPGTPGNPLPVDTVPVVAMSLFYDHTWSDKFTSTIGFSMQDRDLDGTTVDADSFEKGQYALANLLYYPAKNLFAGLELQYGRRKNFNDGWDYDAFRVQFSTKYSFSFRLGDKN